jgi:hypothetical protein
MITLPGSSAIITSLWLPYPDHLQSQHRYDYPTRIICNHNIAMNIQLQAIETSNEPRWPDTARTHEKGCFTFTGLRLVGEATTTHSQIDRELKISTPSLEDNTCGEVRFTWLNSEKRHALIIIIIITKINKNLIPVVINFILGITFSLLNYYLILLLSLLLL